VEGAAAIDDDVILLPVKTRARALAAQRLHAKISRATLPASAAIRVRVSSGRSAAADATVDAIAVADARIAAEADPTAVAHVLTAADAPAARTAFRRPVQRRSRHDRGYPGGRSGPSRRRSSFPKC